MSEARNPWQGTTSLLIPTLVWKARTHDLQHYESELLVETKIFETSRSNTIAASISSILSTPAKLLSQISAAGLVLASAGLGAVYAWTTGSEHGLALACLMTVMAVALEIAKPLALAAAFKSFRAWRIVQGGALVILASVAIAYSLSAELSLMATARGDSVAERNANSDGSTKASGRYDRASLDLNGLSSARSPQELEALISGLLQTPGADGCTQINGKVTKQICPKVADLKVELARSERRAKLEATLVEAERDLKAAPSKIGDPAATALASYLAIFGVRADTSLLTELLVLLGVLALEAGSALAGVLVQAFTVAAPTRVPEIRKRELREEPETANVVQVVHPVNMGDPDDTAQAREKVKNAILAQLKERGGSVSGGERGMAKLIGAKRTTMKRAINGLVLAGVIVAEATRNGTALRLVG